MKVVIFAGGYGTRMWPASRKSYPKQFQGIVHGKSFFRNTYERFESGFSPKDIFVSTEERYVGLVRKQASKIPKENIIIEPERRDLLGAVGLVSAVIEKRYPGSVMFFSWSDHFIKKTKHFVRAVKVAGEFTKKTGKSASIDERPTFPAYMNGWREMGTMVEEINGYKIFEIKRHVEKPDLATAKKFLRDKHFLIHTGYAAWRSDLMLEYYREYRPVEYRGLMKIMEALNTKSEKKVINEEYHKFEKISVEYGLYEKLPDHLRVTIPVSVGWEDAGTWKLFYDTMLEKGEDTVVEGDIKVEQINSMKNLILGSGKKMISIIGLKNLAVIDTKDALLICDLDSTQLVKDLFKKLEDENPEYIE